MAALDNANGNSFPSFGDILAVVQNTSGGPLSVQFTSQPHSKTGRSGSVNQSLAAGEIRVFRFTRDGWEDANGNILMPSGQSASLKIAIVTLD